MNLISQMERADRIKQCIEHPENIVAVIAQLKAENAALRPESAALKEQLSKGKFGRELELEQYVEKCTQTIAEQAREIARLKLENNFFGGE